ncbi:hypothetical protein A2635_01450 [Candidatus Peribacteria bacterium RIFCSPHIGHO2_01_FULL_51_9]|nr:MAG: hypothetical protein A2635_01450 [Candidatus Peribacteria bacterium RIFCSPHIGHO2_01_FULL_51_9]
MARQFIGLSAAVIALSATSAALAQQPGYGGYQQPGYAPGYQQPAGLQPAALPPATIRGANLSGSWSGDLVNSYGTFPVRIHLQIATDGRVTGQHYGYTVKDGNGKWEGPTEINGLTDGSSFHGYSLPTGSTWNNFHLEGSELVVTATPASTRQPVIVRLRKTS